jgi:hypothetical protein
MAIGPGRYDDEAAAVMEAVNASGVILIVIGGDRGEGFEVHATAEVTLKLPEMLRTIADQIEEDIPNATPE